MSRKRVWIKHEDTHVLLEEHVGSELPEWRVMGEVLLRKAYAGFDAKWMAYCHVGIDHYSPRAFGMGGWNEPFDYLSKAKRAVEERVDLLTGA